MHSLVYDHSRLTYSEILADEKGPACAAFLVRAARYFADHHIPNIKQVINDNHFSHRRCHAAAAIAVLGARHLFIKPALPLAGRQGGKAQPHSADQAVYRQVFESNA